MPASMTSALELDGSASAACGMSLPSAIGDGGAAGGCSATSGAASATCDEPLSGGSGGASDAGRTDSISANGAMSASAEMTSSNCEGKYGVDSAVSMIAEAMGGLRSPTST